MLTMFAGPDHAQADETAPALLGPPIAGDLAALREQGLPAVAYFGGHIRALDVEPTRSIGWAVQGLRVVALDMSRDEPRELGWTPVLPMTAITPDEFPRIVAGDGVVLVLDVPSASGAAWWIDGRDPSWPRDVRPLALGAPVTAVAMDGRRALIVAGDELFVLDFAEPGAPVVEQRMPLPDQVRGASVAEVAFDGDVAALSVAAGQRAVIVMQLQTDEPAKVQRLPAELPSQVAIVGDRLFAMDERRVIRTYRGLQADRVELEQEIDFLRNGAPSALRRFVAQERTLVVLAREQLSIFELLDGDAPWRERPLGLTPAVSEESVVVVGGAESGFRLVFFTGHRDELVTYRASQSTSEPLVQAGRWRPAKGSVWQTAARGDALVTIGAGHLDVYDARVPGNPHWRGGEHSVLTYRGSNRNREGGVSWLGDELWIDAFFRLVYGVADPYVPLLLAHLSLHGNSPAAQVGNLRLTASDTELLVFDSALSGLPEIVARRALPVAQEAKLIGLLGNVAWLHAPTDSTRTSSQLIAVDVADPLRPRVLGTTPLGSTVLSAQVIAPRILALLMVTGATTSRVTLVDASDPMALRTRGSLEFDQHVDTRRPLTAGLHVLDSNLYIALDDGRLVRFDVRVPDFPEEARIFQLPVVPYGPSMANGTLWLAGSAGGVMGLRPDDPPFVPTHRAWLPSLTVVRDGR